jgi:outer membrane protein OmpA-like peptidoglycan-associated protein
MKSINAIVLAMLLPMSAAAGSLFPAQPVSIEPGYGANGAGVHSAVPFGRPGEDCAVNPVSMGFSRVEVTTTKLVAGDVISVPALVLFDFDKDAVRDAGRDELSNIYSLLEEAGVTELRIVGHTDSKGTEAYNEALGFRRAAAVALTLEEMGLSTAEVSVESAGELEPVAPNTNPDGSDNPKGRQENRRVEFEVVAVSEKEIEATEVVVKERNPQVFHVLSNNESVNCGLDRQNRTPLLWRSEGTNFSGWRFPY